MTGGLALAGLLLLVPQPPAPVPSPAADAANVIDVRTTRPAVDNFDTLFATHRKALARNEAEASQAAMGEVKKLKIQRNIKSLREVALARIAEGYERLGTDRAQADAAFRDAIALDPRLADGYYGLALAELKRGATGVPGAIKNTLSAVTAGLPSVTGGTHLRGFVLTGLLGTLILAAFFYAGALMVRHGGLLLHDVEEALGARFPPPMPTAVFVAAAVLPLALQSGYGWLPFWWMALLLVYMSRVEQVAAGLLTVLLVLVGPLADGYTRAIVAERNPLFRASAQAVEGGPDGRAIATLEQAARDFGEDKDFTYLLATQYKKAGRYDDAANLYRSLLQKDKADGVALNNLANIEFLRGDLAPAMGRYAEGIKAGPPRKVAATLQYNLSLAHLQKVEYDPAKAARAEADQNAADLTKMYDEVWKYDSPNGLVPAVVDLGLTEEEVAAKFAGTPEGVAHPNLMGRTSLPDPPGGGAGALFNRFSAFVVVFGLVAFGIQRWRGPKMFTHRCQKCGTPFCRLCHLGIKGDPGGLCTQCYHLFLVRDGVSGPARNQKLAQVQREDDRRSRTYRLLSLLAPGAGHVFAQKTVPGLVFILLWSAVLAFSMVGWVVAPLNTTPSALARPWLLAPAALALVVVYVLANRARPQFDVAVLASARRGAPAPRRRAS